MGGSSLPCVAGPRQLPPHTTRLPRSVLALRPARLGASAAPASAARPSGRRAVSGAVVVRASAAEEPETAKEAIELGNSLAKAAK